MQHTWNWTPLTLDTPGQRTALVTGLENTSTHFQVRAVNRGGPGAPATVWGHNVGAGGAGGFIQPVEGYFRENNRRVLWWARFPHDLDEQTGTVAGFIKDDPELSNLNSISWSWTADAGADLTLGGVAHTVTGVSTTASSDGTQLQLRIKPEVPTGSQAALKAALRLYYGSWSLEGSAAQVASGGGVTTFTWTNDVQDFTLLGRPGSKSSGNQDTIGLALSVPSDFTGQQVEVDPPSIDDTPDVSGAGGDAQWSEGETVGVTVTFSEAVDVDTTNGTPSIGLGLGGPTEARSATYASGSGTAELVFEYTLGSGDGTHSFMAVTPDSLALNGGTIRSTSSGVAAVLAHNGTLVQGRASPALSVADASVDEAPGATLAFVVTLDPASATAVTVDYATTDGTATAGDDYTATSGTLTFAATETTKTIAVPVLDDTHEDSGETLTLTLSNAVNARIEDGTATGTINNDEAGLTAQFTQAPPVHDGSTPFLLQFEFSHAPKGYSYRTVRDDLFAVDGGAIAKARRLVKRRHQQWEITVAPDGDGAVRLEAVATLDCTATYAACDADGRKFDGALRLTVPGPATPPALSSASVDGTALTLTFDKALNGGATPPASAFAVTVAGGARTVASVAVSGSAVTLTLASAVTTGETVTVSYTASTGHAAASFADQAVTNGTAANETPAIPVVSVAASTTPVTEGTAAAFTLSRTGATDAALTVTVAVTESGTVLDATPPSSVTFGAGSGTATLSVPTVDDNTVEAASTVTVTVSAGAGYAVAPDAGTAEGVVESEDVEPLTARWTQVPSEHDGSSPFWLHFAFSHNPTSYSYKTVHQQLFDVTGGRITKAHRAVPRSSIGWEIRIEPDGLGAVTLAARATTDCAAPSAACDVDGRKFDGDLRTTVQAPPTLAVADAEVEEAEGVTLDFVVTLSRAVAETVTVAYATADGTATAGHDYDATAGTLTFAANERSQTVSVPVRDDVHDEGQETLTLTLATPSPSRVKLADAAATGTITNNDPLQRAWLSRFGRTVGTHVTDAVGERLRGTPGEASFLTVGGYRVPLGQRDAEPAPDSGPTSASGAAPAPGGPGAADRALAAKLWGALTPADARRAPKPAGLTGDGSGRGPGHGERGRDCG